MIHLVLGGARSGKSSFAEQLCHSLLSQKQAGNTPQQKPIYIATAQAFDEEMQNRIAKHQLDRQDKWQLIECPLKLNDALSVALSPRQLQSQAKQQAEHTILIDCLTLWLNNVIFEFGDSARQEDIALYSEQLLTAVSPYVNKQGIDIVLVANEVGLGVVPLGKVSRLFVDNAGWLNQNIAAIADSVTLITAGIPLTLKGNARRQNSGAGDD
ncbi:bifunctional adenosylcobinamide kinase/adenosylcobinamide-phosphate guanylyltransferase [Thalassotalea sp. ND16A]|uniref:bifunctional adenosylcobinamide kinase/adenosylcobinamide-phosphate guanylyltransferase n=1 Tax=Thalassotalea sp. ND16A TaxID=1535422 RepID=UPI00051A5377|nr:bifunctional adenosylcobinamide kinase/adenosylcobinamide-phosphate guanylyltransferase [Thalassotalea sp. ND16A]KGJ99024.1 Adenosylcobinamide-phosphate guanylyltransferase [Thalassotalea sp. ND16A]